MPFGAALAGRILGKRIVYHYHENAFIKSALYRFLCKVMLNVASEIICVSDYQRSFLPQNDNISVIHNALTPSFTNKLVPHIDEAYNNKKVLMVSSLLLDKGILEYISLAQKLLKYNFSLVINDTDDAIAKFIEKYNIKIPDNLKIYPRQSDVSKFYNEASLLLNLSDRTKIIETFGMTVLEGMSAGLPVIVPTVGGIAEFVEDGVNGYKIDVQEIDSIANRIDVLFSDYKIYKKMADAALITAASYSCSQMCDKIDYILNTK
jgi:glycosyltransferase involved in cell wall biosynthesis